MYTHTHTLYTHTRSKVSGSHFVSNHHLPLSACVYNIYTYIHTYHNIHSTQDTFIRTLEGMKQYMREMQAKQNQMSNLSQPSSTHGIGQGVSSNVGAGMGTGMGSGMGTGSESNVSIMPSYKHNGNYNISTSVASRSLEYILICIILYYGYECTYILQSATTKRP